MHWSKRAIFYLFAGLLFTVPLILWPFTSEVFEFNKIILVYIFTTLISAFWIFRMISEEKIIFRRTILDIPLAIFLMSQLISTVLSVDFSTSFLGYYSRFNGGFLSTLSYVILYWAFVANIDPRQAFSLIKVWLSSAAIVTTYGVLEHFGIDKDIWVQDVQSRVFSTLGQPNWLASWIAAFIPLTWALLFKGKLKSLEFYIYLALSVLFFWTLIFTKSRSGFLGLVSAGVVYSVLSVWFYKPSIKKTIGHFWIVAIPIIVICLVSGTQWTPSIGGYLSKTAEPTVTPQGPALETGGTESGTIRKVVWKGALDIWKNYPVFGTGVETFAYSYYKFRPVEHNTFSEWDFVYNKAHNEFLNLAANTGTVGLISYLALIILASIQMFTKNPISIAFLSGYSALMVTNFFGFSVVPTQLQLFLFPAIAYTLTLETGKTGEHKKPTNTSQIIFMSVVALAALLLLNSIYKYWKADTYYAQAKDYNSQKMPDKAEIMAKKAIALTPNQAIYHNELAISLTSMANAYYQAKDTKKAAELSVEAANEIEKASELSPANVNIKRSKFGIYVVLSTINPNYITLAGNTLMDAIKYAPTDPKFYYNLGLFYLQTGAPDKGGEALKKAIELKPNYKEARIAYAFYLINNKKYLEAKDELNYILKYIDPEDSIAKQTLESIK